MRGHSPRHSFRFLVKNLEKCSLGGASPPKSETLDPPETRGERLGGRFRCRSVEGPYPTLHSPTFGIGVTLLAGSHAREKGACIAKNGAKLRGSTGTCRSFRGSNRKGRYTLG